jgi:EPS-associated MarR family transcriptional regulator
MTLSDENTLQALRVLERNPEMSQRELSKELGVSLGKTHYILSSLIEVGLVKADNFRRSDNKLGYAYLLTPKGIAEKAAVTARFLARKRREYIEIEQQIADLSREVELMRRESGER